MTREEKVKILLARGHSKAEIAEQLQISIELVQTTIEHIQRRENSKKAS